MAGILVLLVIASCAIWVYLDASSHKIGDISEYRAAFNKSPVFWSIGSLVLWPCVFPYYLSMRGKLVDAAIQHPVEENWRSLKATGVTLAALGFIAASMAVPGQPEADARASCDCPGPATSCLESNDVHPIKEARVGPLGAGYDNRDSRNGLARCVEPARDSGAE